MADARQSQPEKSGALEEWRRLVIGREVEEVVRYAYRWTQSRHHYLFIYIHEFSQFHEIEGKIDEASREKHGLEIREAGQSTESHEEDRKHKPPQQPPHSFPQRSREGKKTK